MGIRVECPHGHVFKVKDKYAGKKGLCPHCEGQVIVHVPDTTTTDASDIFQLRAGSVMTLICVTSEPVPQVVGTASSGTIGPGTLPGPSKS